MEEPNNIKELYECQNELEDLIDGNKDGRMCSKEQMAVYYEELHFVRSLIKDVYMKDEKKAS